MRLAIDFGTTNTLIAAAERDGQIPDLLTLPGLSLESGPVPATIPSLIYMSADGPVFGAQVRRQGLDQQHDLRLFRNFKRGIASRMAYPPRFLDGRAWTAREIAGLFLERLVSALPFPLESVDKLVLTAPVAAYDAYSEWLLTVFGARLADRILIADESTAAAAGYELDFADAPVMVVDFGGGTLDLSVVRLPEGKDRTARVIAKAGQILGGGDIDRWLLDAVCARIEARPDALDVDHGPLLAACETAKIALTTDEQTAFVAQIGGRDYPIIFTRDDLAAILTERGFLTTLRHTVDKTMHLAGREGICAEDLGHVLLVGGTSLVPAVRRALRLYFRGADLRAERPFSAVAEGALRIAAGLRIDDTLINSYGLRYLDPAAQTHHYEEIIPAGTRSPSDRPVEIILSAAHADQPEIELVIGMIDPEGASSLTVRMEDGKAVFVANTDADSLRVMPLNEFAPPILIPLNPPGQPGTDRIRAAFTVDSDRNLRITATDLQTQREVLRDTLIVRLR